MAEMNEYVPVEIRAQVSAACTLLNRHLGDALLGAHLFGSAVDGGLKPFSDIDLLVTVGDRVPPSVRRSLMVELLDVSAPPGSVGLRALEVTVLALPEVVPWRYAPRRELQFGEWLRADIVAGVIEGPVNDPDLAILLTKARQHSVALVGEEASGVFDAVPRADLVRALMDTVAQWNGPDDWAGDECNIVLALARIWYTAEMGGIASKDVAATWLLNRWKEGSHHAVLVQARAAYLGLEADALANQPEAVAAFIREARRSIEAL
jgi:streptomycin 3"-adenylyltransferase